MKSQAVKKAADAAEKLHGEIYGNTTVEDAPPVTGETPPEGDPPGDELREVPPPEGKDAPDDTPPAATSEPEPPKNDSVETTEETWEAKYKTLQGMFNAEVPKLQAKIKELDEKNQGLENIVATIQATPDPEAPPPNFETRLTADEVADYGEEMTDFVKRAAMDAVAPELATLRKENEELKTRNLQLEQSVGNVQAESGASAREAMLTTLANDVSDWQVINNSPEFLTWLQETDAFTGQIRHNLLLEAYENNDAPRVIAFFNAYKRDNAIVTPSEAPPTAPSEPTIKLDNLVAPGKGHSVTTPPPSDSGKDKIWSQSDIQTFYRDVQRGKYAGRESEKAQIEQAIVKAGREGRVR